MSFAAHGTRSEVSRERRQPVRLVPAKLRQAKPSELAIRFAFGAGIALVAGVVGMKFGARVGGLFLAFPAVLPASLTLMEKKEGQAQADVDAMGAILGAVAMVAFAVCLALLQRGGGPFAGLAAAWVVWVVVAFGLFFVVRRLLNSR